MKELDKNVNTIQIRAWYSGWRTVDRDKALQFVTLLKSGMMCRNKNKWINENHLRGITCEELEKNEGV